MKIEFKFTPRKFIQFTLIKLFFIFLDLEGGLYDEHTVNQQFPFQNWGGGGLYAGIYGTFELFCTFEQIGLKMGCLTLTINQSVKQIRLKNNFENKTHAKHRDIFRPVRLHQLSHSYFGRGNRI